jgi:hypothetical protein
MGDYGPLLGGPKMQSTFVDGSPGATGSTDLAIYVDRSGEVTKLCWKKILWQHFVAHFYKIFPVLVQIIDWEVDHPEGFGENVPVDMPRREDEAQVVESSFGAVCAIILNGSGIGPEYEDDADSSVCKRRKIS